MITTDEELISIPLEKRNCLFDKEAQGYSTMFKTYSQDGCLFECKLRSIQEDKGCMPWNFPQLDTGDQTKRLCNAPEAYHFMSKFSSVELEECSCPTDCNVHSYILGFSKEPMDNVIS